MSTPSPAEFRWRVDHLTGRALGADEGARWSPPNPDEPEPVRRTPNYGFAYEECPQPVSRSRPARARDRVVRAAPARPAAATGRFAASVPSDPAELQRRLAEENPYISTRDYILARHLREGLWLGR